MTLLDHQEIKEPDFDSIPEALKNHAKWMLWKAEPTKKNPNIMGKVPYLANGLQGQLNNPKHYLTFDQVKRAYKKGGFDGVGVVINSSDNLVCIDLDDIDDIKMLDAEKHMWTLHSYTELSPSEKGLHIWIKGKKPEWARTKKNGIEFFGSKADKFITVTGNVVTPKPIVEHQKMINHIAEKYFKDEKLKQKIISLPFKQVPDNVVLQKMFNSKHGEKIKRLYDGDISNFESQSEADLSLCNHLAYWTNNNAEQMDRLFRQSGLYRDKWDERRGNSTYGSDTIDEAIRGNRFKTESTEEETKEDDADSWQQDLEYKIHSKTGETYLVKNSRNIELILENKLGAALAYDIFSNDIILKNNLPWRKIEDNEVWQSHDYNQLEHWFSTQWDITGKDKILNALVHVTQKRASHPIKEFIEKVQWDGEIRIPTFFCDYLGADASEYTTEITKRWFTGAIKRIYEAGCKFEIVPILIGKKGIGKSFVGSKLANEKWFTDSLSSLDPKIVGEILSGTWICELSELKAFSRKNDEEIKAFISSTNDKYRGAYEKGNASDHKRHTVFYGTSNKTEILTDETGERRRFPIKCSGDSKYNPFKDLTPEVVSQLWAEAKAYYDMNYITFVDAGLQSLAEDVFQTHVYIDPMQDDVKEYAEKIEAEGRFHLCINEIWDHVFDPKNKPTKRDADRVKSILLSLGYEKMDKKQKCGTYNSRVAYTKKQA